MVKSFAYASMGAALLLLGAGSAIADSGAMLFRFTHDFGKRSVDRLGFTLVRSRTDLDPGRRGGVELILYASDRAPPLARYADDGGHGDSFCARHWYGCVALGAVIGGVALYLVKQADKDSRDSTVSVRFSSGSVDVRSTAGN